MGCSTELLITEDTLIPDLLRRFPSTRAVFDQYGLKGCGGAEGPHESLRVFARAHEVDLPTLLQELSESSQTHAPLPTIAAPELGDVIYRRFFIAAVIFLMTLGASWGAHILAKIAKSGSFVDASILSIQAHAQAQVYGWMGLVVMGFAYQAFPRFWKTSLRNPSRANLSFWSMVLGIVASASGIYFATLPFGLPLSVVGGAMELSAVVLFAWELAATFRLSGKKLEPYIAYVFVALAWFVAGTAVNLVHTWALVLSAKHPEYAAMAAAMQSGMRDMQFEGFALTMIAGVSLRTLPHIFGLNEVKPRVASASLLAVTIAVIAQVAFGASIPAVAVVSHSVLLLVAALLTVQFGIWKKFAEGDRSEKFIRAAWIWLIISVAMLIATPLYSHAYLGAARHAITVGFISLMIMGYGAKVVATLNGFDTRNLTSLILPFALVNIGCTIRVLGQAVTTTYPAAFPLVGVSGVFETIGMGMWGWHILNLIIAGQSELRNNSAKVSAPKPEAIEEHHIVHDVLDWFPQTEPIFIEFGFSAVTNPIMRMTVARQVTIKKACQMHNIDSALFVAALNDIATSTRCVGCTGGGCGDKD